MDIKQFLTNLIHTNIDEECYLFAIDSAGLNFYLPQKLFDKAEKIDVNELLLQQHMHLKILEEEGIAEPMKNGFTLQCEDVVNLDENTVHLLQLPKRWDGRISLDIRGNATSGYTDCFLSFVLPNGKVFNSYTIDGPFLKFTNTIRFLLDNILLSSLKRHSKFQEEKQGGSIHNESDFYHLFSSFEQAKQANHSISLGHLDDGFTIISENKSDTGISISLTLNDDGSGELAPVIVNSKSSSDDIVKRLGQLDFKDIKKEQVLRVGKEIILVNEERISAIKEILENKKLSAREVEEFQKSPTAFIDGSKVILENGFSLRVKGVTIYKEAYFGETDKSGINWFGKELEQSSILSIIDSYKCNSEILLELQELINVSEQNNLNQIDFEGEVYNFKSQDERNSAKEIIKRYIETPVKDEFTDDINSDENKIEEEKDPSSELILNPDVNDEEQNFSKEINTLISEVSYKGLLTYSNIKRTPYPHQETGIKWMLGLVQKGVPGGLLADDMGLGKTLTALIAIQKIKELQLFKQNDKPTLVVAPLSLLDNWKDEVYDTFHNSPFSDITILNGEEMRKYKIGKNSGREISNQTLEALENMDKIRYALKIGSGFGEERLDKSNRLIITTYQTVRDYQFSLSRIAWNFVVFDEAQNIKNPNALQTRAAKALNADFTLMMTGTPVENSLADFWCIMDTAIPSEQLLGTYQEFRGKYITPIMKAKENKSIVQVDVGRKLRKAVKYFMLRRNKEDELEGIPKKLLYSGMNDGFTEYIPVLSKVMNGIQQKKYEAVIQNVASSESKRGVAFMALHKLRNISLHPSLHTSMPIRFGESLKELHETMGLSGKMESLTAILDQIAKRNEKVIIFAVNKELQRFLKGALVRIYKLHNVIVINGDTKAVSKKLSKTKSRKELIGDFEAKDGFNIIIMSPVAAGVGLTVVGANNVIHFERHWNPAKEAQATDRVYRIGQKKDVNVYYPILKHSEFDSFDVSLHALLINKTILRDAVVTPEEVIPEGCVNFGNQNFSNGEILPNEIGQLSWQQFEALCVVWAKSEFNTIEASLTASSNDHGVDVVVLNHEGVLIQSKCTMNEKYSSSDGIRELNSGPEFYNEKYNRKFNIKIFMTNAVSVSPAVKKEAQLYKVRVVTGKEIMKWLEVQKVSYREIEELLSK